MKRSEACSACKIRPVRAPKQRYCKECHKEAATKSRIARKVRIAEMEDELFRLRRMIDAARST